MALVSSAAVIADASVGGSCDPPVVVAAEIPFQVFGNVGGLPALIPILVPVGTPCVTSSSSSLLLNKFNYLNNKLFHNTIFIYLFNFLNLIYLIIIIIIV